MELFCFASRSEENIAKGVARGLWAVAPPRDERFMDAQIKKSQNLLPDAKGIIYCNCDGARYFTVPFIVRGEPELREEIDVWAPQKWWLPFEISPLGDQSRQVPVDVAKNDWPFVGSGLNKIVPPTTTFNRIEITVYEWNSILVALGNPH